MTVIYGQHFVDGLILIADSRASKSNKPWADNTQKIFRLGDYLFLSFCGDIGWAGSIIAFLIDQIRKNPLLSNPHIFFIKGPKLIKFAYGEIKRKIGKEFDVGFIIAGMDFNRPELVMENDKVVGYVKGLFDKKLFKLSSPDFEVTEANFFKQPILILGSGTPALESLEEDFKGLYKFGGLGDVGCRALVISGSLKEKAEKLGINSVGGLFQIIVIDQNGSRFVPYKSRSPENKDPIVLDLEMAIRDGRWVQRNLKTGKETVLLFPPEVVSIDSDSPELFAILRE